MQKEASMGVLLQGFYKLRPNRAVPSPADGDSRGTAAGHGVLEARTVQVGFHTLRIKLNNAAGGVRRAYKLAVTYAGQQQPAGHSEASVAEPASADRAAADPKEVGRWDPRFSLPNVAIHTHLLPNGKVLFWGRRDQPKPIPRRAFLHAADLGSRNAHDDTDA
jgi:hypothetical protein